MGSTALFKLSYGLFVLTSIADGRPCGCIVNTAIQQTDQPLRISVTVSKANRTCEAINESGRFCVSVLDVNTSFDMIKRFGFQSSRDTDKFLGVNAESSPAGLAVIKENTCAFIEAKVVHKLDQGTHIMFLGTVTDAQTLSDTPPLTYAYYHSHIKPKPQPTPAKTGWRCRICGYVHEGAELPEDFICPTCKHGAADFEPIASDINNNNNKINIKLKEKML